MSFLNLFPVWGTLAAIGIAVPIIIHLLYRKIKKEVNWKHRVNKFVLLTMVYAQGVKEQWKKYVSGNI